MSTRTLSHLPASWPQHSTTVQQHGKIVVLSDYDGTLTPIAATPTQAVLSDSTRAVLKRLSRLSSVQVGVISGRSLQDTKRAIGLPGLVYGGNHGLELQGLGLRFLHPEAKQFRPILFPLAGTLRKALAEIPGALVEWKGLTISLHWRQVPPRSHQRFRSIVARHLAPYLAHRLIRVTHGKRVIELRPPLAWNKGEGIAWLLRHLALSFRSPWTRALRRTRARHSSLAAHVIPIAETPSTGRRRQVRGTRKSSHAAEPTPFLIYFGDDRTDETAFRIVNRLHGLSVFVGRPTWPTAARYWLRNVQEVHAWLEALSRACRPG